MTTTYERHEYSAIFPDMQPAEYTALRESIKASGQVHPIIVFQGQVLDGWQRYRVCQELGIEPAVKEFEGDESAPGTLHAGPDGDDGGRA